jgi:restriction system protein
MEALTAIFSMLYPFWPLIVLLGFRPFFKPELSFIKRLRCGVKDVFIFWLIWAFFYGFVLWQGKRPILILTEGVNNLAFVGLGAVSGGITLVWTFWLWRENRIRISNLQKLEDLTALSPSAFEAVVAKLFEAQGYRVELVGGTSDHGVDIVMWNAQGEKWIVQCKRYIGSVGEPVVRDLYGTLLHEEAQGAFLVTTGSFTQQASEWAVGKPISLFDGEDLVQRLREMQSLRKTHRLQVS